MVKVVVSAGSFSCWRAIGRERPQKCSPLPPSRQCVQNFRNQLATRRRGRGRGGGGLKCGMVPIRAFPSSAVVAQSHTRAEYNVSR